MAASVQMNNLDMGAPENRLKMLSADLQYLVPKRFFEYSPLNKTDIAKEAGINRKTLYSDKVKLSTLKKLKKGIMQVVIGTDLAVELFGDNTEEAVNWFQTPNTLLFGESPFEVCIRGEGKFLINWLMGRLGKDGAIEN
tara:strand:- start:590 stop:1006 length:417 start_codon:yes stop_codon:yes gene_type:complete